MHKAKICISDLLVKFIYFNSCLSFFILGDNLLQNFKRKLDKKKHKQVEVHLSFRYIYLSYNFSYIKILCSTSFVQYAIWEIINV